MKEIININVNDEVYECIIIKKKIKHSYFKLKPNNKILVSVNNKLKREDIIKLLEINIVKLINKANKIEIIKPFSIFGVIQTQQYFIDNLGLLPNNENIKEIYIKLTEEKIRELNPHINDLIQNLNLSLLPTKVKVLKSKYGSVHLGRKYIVINAKLALLPINYLKYVLIHEYAHLIEPNHSKKFYDVVRVLMPDYLTYHQSLKRVKLILG